MESAPPRMTSALEAERVTAVASVTPRRASLLGSSRGGV
eukprot:CAMPEP_0180275772 /NCGR_PEP_ID=MMETSP0988-20121125/6016_1 /TAXON_ID=697907 /ORGANISM="non described non described, Strain CCMP2293" /LENGTH=38 /DNA_ID= /DNA_START= /DNA_END= /DNA_ORIENTATION=